MQAQTAGNEEHSAPPHWPAGAWKPVGHEIAPAMLERLNPLFEPVIFQSDTTLLHNAGMSFWPGWQIVALTDLASQPVVTRYVLCRGGARDAHLIDWTRTPVDAVNEAAPLRLDGMNVLSYLRFYFAFVHGRHGAMQLVESRDDFDWKPEVTPDHRRQIASQMTRLTLRAHHHVHGFVVEGVMLFKAALVRCLIDISPGGVVALRDERLLGEDVGTAQKL